MGGGVVERSARGSAAATAAAIVVAARAAVDVNVGHRLRQPSLHRRVASAFEGHHHVVGAPLPLELPPSVGQQVLLSLRGGLAKLVGARHLHIQALVQDLSVVSHRGPRVTGVKHPPTCVDS